MRKLLFIGVVIGLFGMDVSAQDSYFRGFYHGQNVFVRNPYLESENDFCIQAIYLNGKLVTEHPNVSAYQIQMQHLEFDSRVVIRIVHHEDCQPELTNPEVIDKDYKFSWLKIYVDQEQIIWITTKESQKGHYIVERDTPDGWQGIDTVKTKGGIFVNQYSREVDHINGDNLYRVQYYDPKIEVKTSDSFNFYSDKVEISHAIDEENWIIEFTQEVQYFLYNRNNRIVKRGKDVSCSLQKFPAGRYTIKYEDKEYTFEKK